MIDPFTIKPLDSKTIIDNAKATRGRIITVEDHYYEGEGTGVTNLGGIKQPDMAFFLFFFFFNIVKLKKRLSVTQHPEFNSDLSLFSSDLIPLQTHNRSA